MIGSFLHAQATEGNLSEATYTEVSSYKYPPYTIHLCVYKIWLQLSCHKHASILLAQIKLHELSNSFLTFVKRRYDSRRLVLSLVLSAISGSLLLLSVMSTYLCGIVLNSYLPACFVHACHVVCNIYGQLWSRNAGTRNGTRNGNNVVSHRKLYRNDAGSLTQSHEVTINGSFPAATLCSSTAIFLRLSSLSLKSI